jgi:hypothetical protein
VPIDRSGSAGFYGWDDFRKKLARLENNEEAMKAVKDLNQEVAAFIVNRAKPRMAALGGAGSRAAATMVAQRSIAGARLSLGGAKAPFAEGVEFGAHRNRRRIVKNTGGRATIVRDGEDISTVIRRVESQTIDYRRRTTKKGFRGDLAEQVKATKVIRGWNQFREWRGNGANAGYALYPTMRANREQIVEIWGKGIDRITREAFPDD